MNYKFLYFKSINNRSTLDDLNNQIQENGYSVISYNVILSNPGFVDIVVLVSDTYKMNVSLFGKSMLSDIPLDVSAN